MVNFPLVSKLWPKYFPEPQPDSASYILYKYVQVPLNEAPVPLNESQVTKYNFQIRLCTQLI